jgi:hypothetical protein
MAAIVGDAALDADQREQRTAAHVGEYVKRVSPKFIIHTAGVQLAATGDLAFARAYARRRASLCDLSGPFSVGQVLADDHYGIIHMVVRTARGEKVLDRVAISAWRFENGLAVEHWELINGHEWDAFFLAGDPDFQSGSAAEFWIKS